MSKKSFLVVGVIIVVVILALSWSDYYTRGLEVGYKVDSLENNGYTVYRAKTFPYTDKKIKYKTFNSWFEELENTANVNPYILRIRKEVYLLHRTFWFKDSIGQVHYVEVE